MPRNTPNAPAAPDVIVHGKPLSAYTTDELLKLKKFGRAILGDPEKPETGQALYERAQKVATETKGGRFGPAILADPAHIAPPKPAA